MKKKSISCSYQLLSIYIFYYYLYFFKNKEPTEEFDGKIGLVTGGAAGIGLKCCQLLLHKGVQKLVVVDLNVNVDACRKLASTYGKSRVIFIKCDVSNESEMEKTFDSVFEKLGRIDFVINNAGILDDFDWRNQISTNINGTIIGTLLGMKHMSKFRGGSGGTIINISSLAGLIPSGGCPIYSATSSAIISLTRAFSLPFHYSRSEVKMMTICPGITYTRIIAGACKKMLDEETGKEWLKDLSNKSTQQPENVATCVAQILMHGENGSIWVSEGGHSAYQVKMPSIDVMKVM